MVGAPAKKKSAFTKAASIPARQQNENTDPRIPGFIFGPHPQYGWDFPEEIPEKFRKDPGNALRAFPGISFESTAGMPQTYN